MMQSKMMASGGMTKKNFASGGAATSKLAMVMGKDGKKVPSFVADGKSKMAAGNMTKKMMGGSKSRGKR